jgi:hypothetical protein
MDLARRHLGADVANRFNRRTNDAGPLGPRAHRDRARGDVREAGELRSVELRRFAELLMVLPGWRKRCLSGSVA